MVRLSVRRHGLPRPRRHKPLAGLDRRTHARATRTRAGGDGAVASTARRRSAPGLSVDSSLSVSTAFRWRGGRRVVAPGRPPPPRRTTTTPHTGKTSYWDERYTKDPEPFDWYQRYSGIQELLQKYVKKDDAVLMAGCGNSRLSEDMFEDGFANISNVDISRVVIDQMGDKYKDKPALTFQQMNVCSLGFPDESFDIVCFTQVTCPMMEGYL